MNITIIGLGGTGALVAAALGPLSGQHRLAFMDADTFDAKNQERQFLANISSAYGQVGGWNHFEEPVSKAIAATLLATFDHRHPIQAIERWADDTMAWEDFGEPDVIICCVDNNATRRMMLRLADRWLTEPLLEKLVPIIFPGNGNTFGQCLTYFAGHPDYDWRKHTPQWLDADDEHPRDAHDPAGRCTTAAQLEDQPQTSSANLMAASLAVMHLWDAEHMLRNPSDMDFKIHYSTFNGPRVANWTGHKIKELPCVPNTTPENTDA